MDWPDLTHEQVNELRDVIKRIKRFESQQNLSQILKLSSRDSKRSDRNSVLRKSDGGSSTNKDPLGKPDDYLADHESFGVDLPPIVTSSVRELKLLKGRPAKLILPTPGSKPRAKHSSLASSPDRSPCALTPLRAESPVLTKRNEPVRLPSTVFNSSKPFRKDSTIWAASKRDSYENARFKKSSKSPSPTNTPVLNSLYSDWEVYEALKTSKKQVSIKDKRKHIVASLKSMQTFMPLMRSS
mmetsp:Transcript_11128/g.21869  ORF Transcript_11128/g.21869 Transcript_11128/m.21869 type:complete len:241 (+) Transcript_11128:111-833(+)